MDKTLRARVALTEIEAMGLTLDDLLTAAGRESVPVSTGPTVLEYIAIVALRPTSRGLGVPTTPTGTSPQS